MPHQILHTGISVMKFTHLKSLLYTPFEYQSFQFCVKPIKYHGLSVCQANYDMEDMKWNYV